MKVELLGWESKGLRCPDMSVELTQHGRISPVSLIQMPNGTGKTTALQLLTAALDGSATKWSPERVRTFRRAGETGSKGQFLAKLLVDERPLTFDLSLDFDEGHARYRTTSPGSGGVVSGHNPGPTLNRFLTPQFTSLFVFDGEFADRLLDTQQSEAERAIDALCQLYLLGDIAEFSEQEWTKATRRGGPTTQVGLAALQQRRAAVQKRIATLNQHQATAKKQQGELEERIKKLEELIANHMSRTKDVNEAYDRAKSALADAENRVTIESSAMMQSIRLPHVLHACIPLALTSLKANLDRLQLPENTSAQFFDELLQEPNCICGREMTDAARQSIRARAQEYLGTEEAGVINALKKDIDQYTTESEGGDGHARLLDSNQKLSAAVRERQQAEGLVRSLKQQLIDGGDEKLRDWETELNAKQAQTSKVLNTLKVTTADNPDDDRNKTEDGDVLSIPVLTRRLADIDARLSELTKTVKLHNQTKLIKKIAMEARDLARDNIRARVLVDCNERLRRVLSQDPIQLEGIGDSLHLAHQTGASVGQTLAVGYTFLMSVLSRGQNQFPLIVDSPANPLDAGRRRAIGNFIPQLCNQFVGFTISTERLGFVTALEATKTPIKYLTLFRKTAGTGPLMATLPKKGVQQTGNGVLVEDRDYFHAFDLIEEEAD